MCSEWQHRDPAVGSQSELICQEMLPTNTGMTNLLSQEGPHTGSSQETASAGLDGPQRCAAGPVPEQPTPAPAHFATCVCVASATGPAVPASASRGSLASWPTRPTDVSWPRSPSTPTARPALPTPLPAARADASGGLAADTQHCSLKCLLLSFLFCPRPVSAEPTSSSWSPCRGVFLQRGQVSLQPLSHLSHRRKRKGATFQIHHAAFESGQDRVGQNPGTDGRGFSGPCLLLLEGGHCPDQFHKSRKGLGWYLDLA